MLPSLNLESMSDSSPVESIMANLCASAREWFEVTTTGAWRQDRLTYEDATTGMPTALPANVYARSVIPIMAAGTYVVAWDGAATVSVALFTGGGGSGSSSADLPDDPGIAAKFSGSSMSEYWAVNPVGPLAAGGRFTFAHDGTSRQAWLTITDIGPTDPPTNLRVTRIEDEAGWQGFSSEWLARMAVLRPQCVRLLDIMEPNTTRGTITTWAQRRPNTWWTQSNVYLDVHTIPASGWTGTAPALGDTLTWSGGSGPLVRTSSPVAGAIGHVKVSGSAAGAGVVVTCTRTGATATMTGGGMGPWMPEVRGPSELWMRDLAAVLMPHGLTHLWLTTYYGAVDDWHTQLATTFSGDARLNGLNVVPEFGNESWNTTGSFSVGYNYCNTQGTLLGMPGANDWERGGQYYAHRQRQIHNLWRAVYSGRETEIPRVFCGQNSAGEYWFLWRTVINPDSGSFGSWTNEVLPIDAWSVAAYIGHVDESPYNTATWWVNATDQAVLDYLVNDQLPKHITSAPTGGLGFRSGGFRSASVYAAERGCELWAYEANFHMYGLQNSTAMVSRVTTWMRTPYCAAAFRALWEAVATYATGPVCWYNSSRQWGYSGWWGMIENPYDGTSNDVRWQVMVTSSSGQVVEMTFSEADTYVSARPSRFALTLPQDTLLRSRPATFRVAGSDSLLEITLPTTVTMKSMGASVTLSVDGCKFTVDGDYDTKSVGAVLVTSATESRFLVGAANGDEAELSSSPAVCSVSATSSSLQGSDVQLISSPASCTTNGRPSTMTAVPISGGGKIIRVWVAAAIANIPKAIGVEIRRGSLLSLEMAGPVLAASPLRGGSRFAGVAASHAEPTEGAASISRMGTFDIELEDPPGIFEPGDRIDVVAIDDQRVMSEKYAISLGDSYTPIGVGWLRGDGICSVTYAAEGFDATNAR